MLIYRRYSLLAQDGLSTCLLKEHSPFGGKYYCTAGLLFYKFGFTRYTTYK